MHDRRKMEKSKCITFDSVVSGARSVFFLDCTNMELVAFIFRFVIVFFLSLRSILLAIHLYPCGLWLFMNAFILTLSNLMANAVDKIDRVFVLINQKIVHYSVVRMCFCIFLVHFFLVISKVFICGNCNKILLLLLFTDRHGLHWIFVSGSVYTSKFP